MNSSNSYNSHIKAYLTLVVNKDLSFILHLQLIRCHELYKIFAVPQVVFYKTYLASHNAALNIRWCCK